jgi:hypothetical protein
MGKLRPIGSEKLQGMDKINRILEISRYKEIIPNPINESNSVDYSKTLADGNKYHIIKEKNGYVIKKSLNESVGMEYIEPMKNRKYYSSYSQAFKRLNLIAKEVNINEGYENNVNLFEGEMDEKAATKYILKFGETKEQAPAPAPAPVPAPAPNSTPSPEIPSEPTAEPSPEEVDTEIDMDMDMDSEEDTEEEVVTFKTIQKLTGKLAQKIRTLNDNEEQQMSSKDIKYVINSVLSALELNNLDEEDMEDIVNKLEGSEEEVGDMGGGEEEVDMEVEEPVEPSVEPEGEMEEKMNPDEFVDDIFSGLEEGEDVETKENKHMKKIGDMIEGMFTESKVDNILKKYFSINEHEKKQIKLKQVQILENKKNTVNKVNMISETVSQEIMAKKLVSKYPQAKLIGKTKNKNLVFEIKNKQIKVSPNGQIL